MSGIELGLDFRDVEVSLKRFEVFGRGLRKAFDMKLNEADCIDSFVHPKILMTSHPRCAL